MIENVFVVIRGAGERTTSLCKTLIREQVAEENIQLIHERPFRIAVEKTFKLGIRANKKWTLAVDADVLLTPNAIEKMINKAENLSEQLYIYQGYVKDKIYGSCREGGPHLYQTKYLNEALQVLTTNDSTLRPESDTYKVLSEKEGYVKYVDNQIYGLHDYMQFYKDLYRKGFFHALKHTKDSQTARFVNHWKKNFRKDKDYRVIFHGFLAGLEKNDTFKTDINFFNNLTDEKLSLLGNLEKSKTLEINSKEANTFINNNAKLNDGEELTVLMLPIKKKSILYILFNLIGRATLRIGNHLISVSKRL